VDVGSEKIDWKVRRVTSGRIGISLLPVVRDPIESINRRLADDDADADFLVRRIAFQDQLARCQIVRVPDRPVRFPL
jgi:hypothetical protein